MEDGPVLLEKQGRIAIVTLNRPEKLNAINAEVQQRLRAIWDEVAEDDSVRVAILKGSGRAFSAGADLTGGGSSRSTGEGAAPRRAHGVAQDRQGIINSTLKTGFMAWDLPKPVIGQIHGYCLGVANVLASLTDMRIVAEDAQIGWPTLPLGGGLISPFWAWYAGPALAKEFSMTVGKKISGKEAAHWGWANRAVPLEELEVTTMTFAKEIAKVSSDLLAIKKAAINHQMESMGFRRGVMLGAEMDAIAHTTESTSYIAQKRAELGLRGTYEWWDTGEGIP